MEHSREKALEICQSASFDPWFPKTLLQNNNITLQLQWFYFFCFVSICYDFNHQKKKTQVYTYNRSSHTSLILVRTLLVVNRDRERERERDPKQKTKEISREILRDRESGSWFVGTEGQLFAKGSPKINFISFSLSSL